MKVLVLTLLACAVAVMQPVEAQQRSCKCIHIYIVLVYKSKAYFEPIWLCVSLFLLQLTYGFLQVCSIGLQATLKLH